METHITTHPHTLGTCDYYRDEKTGKWIAYENLTGDDISQTFDTEQECINWVEEATEWFYEEERFLAK